MEIAARAESTHEQDRSTWGRGVLASYGNLTPAAKDPKSDAIEVGRLRFSWRDICVLAVALGAFWSLRSDIRDIGTRMETQRQVSVEKDKLEDLWRATIKERLDSNDKKYELLRLEFQEMREQMLYKDKVK